MTKCFVKHCKNSDRRRSPGVTFHKIPRKRINEWLEAIGRPADTFVVNQRVCSEHFKANDFYDYGQLRTLRENAIPSLKLSATEGKQVAATTAILLTEEGVKKRHLDVDEAHAFPKPEVAHSKSGTVRKQLFEVDNEPSTSTARSVIRFRMDVDTDKPEDSTMKKEISSSDTTSTASSLKRKRKVIQTIHRYSPPQPNNSSENSTQQPRPRYIVIVGKNFVRNQRLILPKIDPNVHNSNENSNMLVYTISETGDFQVQSTYAIEAETNDEKVEDTQFEFVDCMCKTELDEHSKDFITSEDVMVKEEVEEEFEATTSTCVNIKNEESSNISLKQPDDFQENVEIPSIINHELFIKDEIIGEESEIKYQGH